MLPKAIFTATWEANVSDFLARNSFNAQLQGYVKRLERRLDEDAPIPTDKGRGVIFIDTKLPGVAYRWLSCECAINEASGDFAPAILYFPAAKRTEDMNAVAKALDDVRNELGW